MDDLVTTVIDSSLITAPPYGIDLLNPAATAIYGTDGNDAIEGRGAGGLIFGLAGHDTIYGRGGNDEIYGDEGDDIIRGGYGRDTLTGGVGADLFQFDFDAYMPGDVDIVTDFNENEGDSYRVLTFPPYEMLHVFSYQLFYDGQNTPESLPGQASLDGLPTLGYSADGGLYFDPDGSGSSYTLQKIAQIAGAPDFSNFQIEGAIYI
jgi:Ca2+-binding RTX toxin-like protein